MFYATVATLFFMQPWDLLSAMKHRGKPDLRHLMKQSLNRGHDLLWMKQAFA